MFQGCRSIPPTTDPVPRRSRVRPDPSPSLNMLPIRSSSTLETTRAPPIPRSAVWNQPFSSWLPCLLITSLNSRSWTQPRSRVNKLRAARTSFSVFWHAGDPVPSRALMSAGASGSTSVCEIRVFSCPVSAISGKILLPRQHFCSRTTPDTPQTGNQGLTLSVSLLPYRSASRSCLCARPRRRKHQDLVFLGGCNTVLAQSMATQRAWLRQHLHTFVWLRCGLAVHKSHSYHQHSRLWPSTARKASKFPPLCKPADEADCLCCSQHGWACCQAGLCARSPGPIPR